MSLFYFLLFFAAVVGLPFAACFAAEGAARLLLPAEEKFEAGLYGVLASGVAVVLEIFPGLPILMALKPEWL